MSEIKSYTHNNEFIDDSLLLLDIILCLKIRRLRINAYSSIDSRDSGTNPPLFISEDEVDTLLKNNNKDTKDEKVDGLKKQIKAMKRMIEEKAGHSSNTFLALPHLAQLFNLSDFELFTVVICLAPELNRKYDKLYAYFQDDITRKRPSVDLVLQLLCESDHEKWAHLEYFHESAGLFLYGILEKIHDTTSPSGSTQLSCFLKVSPRIINFLLGNNFIDEELLQAVKVIAPGSTEVTENNMPENKESVLIHQVKNLLTKRQPEKSIFYIHGPDEDGKKEIVSRILKELHLPVLYADMADLLACETGTVELIKKLTRESLLIQSALFISNIDLLCREDNSTRLLRKELQDSLERYSFLTFLTGEKEGCMRVWFKQMNYYSLCHTIPEIPEREKIWKKELAHFNVNKDEMNKHDIIETLSTKYQLTGEQIHNAVTEIINQVSLENKTDIDFAALAGSCRKQSSHHLGDLAQRIESKSGWDDLVLPEKKKNQLKDICGYIDIKEFVFRKWGFENKYSYGKGLSLLFSGMPGTGKTLSAEIIAKESHLDLFKIDLSRVVSKYIGETEKNLSAIFKEAKMTSSILFFDEADALFGKRTEISDAHDRYANVETSFLLQKMEEYDGVVILATNMKENMDEAFTRRIKFMVDFPFPDQEMRFQIWKTLFPENTPLADDIDFNFLAQKYTLAGGNIKNIVLHAALLGASNGKIIRMENIIKGVKREYEKLGRIWN